MKTLPRCLIIFVLLGMCITAPMLSQSGESDSTRHPYRVNYWVSGPLLAAGLTANLLGLEGIRGKATITPLELQALDRDLLSSMDRFALRQDPADIDAYLEYSNYIRRVQSCSPSLFCSTAVSGGLGRGARHISRGDVALFEHL